MAVDGAVIDVDVLAVGGIDELVAALDHAGPGRERLDQQELGHRELDGLAVPGALVLGLVERQLAAHHDPARRRAGALRAARLVAAEQGADALDQQALAERLGDVVVGAQPKPHQLIDLLVLAGEEDHRHGAAAAQALQQLHAVHARHLHVEHGEIDGTREQPLQRALAVGVGADREAFLLERHADRGQDVAVVVHQRDRVLHHLLPSRGPSI